MSDQSGQPQQPQQQPDASHPPQQPGQPVPPGWAPVQPPAYPPAGPGQPAGWGGSPPGPPPGGAPGWGPQPGWGAANQGWAPPPKPGVIPLRPLGVGEILDGAISTMRAHPRSMIGFSALVAVASQLVMVPLTYLLLRDAGDVAFQVDQPASTEDEFAFAASSISAVALSLLVTLVATLILTGILTVVVSRAVLGQRITTGEAWQQARPRLPALFGVTVLVFLIVLVVAIVGLGPGIVLAAANAPGPLVAVAFVVGVPLFLAAAVYLYVAFALAPPTVVLERLPVVASLRRSRALVKGAWWRTFGILLLVNVIAQILAGILSVPFTIGALGATFFTGEDVNPYEIIPLLITAVGTIVAGAITWPFTAAATALLYVDRRMRREALDMQLTRAAGLAPAGQSATPGTTPDA